MGRSAIYEESAKYLGTSRVGSGRVSIGAGGKVRQVTSPHNQAFKGLKQLAGSSKHRKRSKQTLVEGVHLCESYLQHKGTPLICVYTEPALKHQEVLDILESCSSDSVQKILLSEANFKTISSLENGIGIMFVVAIPDTEPPMQVASSALLLEDVQDPGNMGAILRTAAAAGVTEVYASTGSSSAWSPRVLRAGMGAHFVLNIYENSNLGDVIKSSRVQVLATSLEASESIYSKNLTKPAAWLFGNEGAGVSDELMSLGVDKVIIPQNSDVESLNVAASVAVCLFEQRRQMT